MVLEFDKDGNLIAEVSAQQMPQQFQGIVGPTPQYYSGMVPQNQKLNAGAQMLIGILFPWILFGGFALMGAIASNMMWDSNDYDEEEIKILLVSGNGVNTEFSGVASEIKDVPDMCGGITIYNWHPPPQPYDHQWIEIGALESYGYGGYGTDCEDSSRTIWLFRQYEDENNRQTENITEIGQLNANGDGFFELSFDNPPPDGVKIEYQYWPYDYEDYDDIDGDLIGMLCCMFPAVIYIGAIVVGYAKGFVAFSNGALISVVGSFAIFFVGCFAMLFAFGF